MLGSCLGGVCGCDLRSSVLKAEVKRLWQMPGRGLEWIPEKRVSSKGEKTSWVSSLEESGAGKPSMLKLSQAEWSRAN